MTAWSMFGTRSLQRADHAGVLRGHGVADGVGDVDRRRAGLDRRLDDLAEEVELGAGGVLGGELDVVAVALGPAARSSTARSMIFVAGHLELELAVDRAGGQEDVDPRRLGVLERLPGAVDVALVAAGQAADGRAGDLGGDRADRLEVARRGDREAGLDDVDAESPRAPGPPPASRPCSCSRRAIARRRAASCRRSGSGSVRFASAMAVTLP